MTDIIVLGFEIVYLCILICIPFIIAHECFFYVSISFVCVYVANYICKKKTARTIDVIGQGIFITGCDSGFGFGLAKRLDSMGFTVFAGCLQENSDGATTLKSSTTGRLHVIQLDVTKDKSVEDAVKFVKNTDLKTQCGLWAVVNNAGIQVVGEVEFCTMDIYHKVAEVNMFGMVRVTKAFLPLIRKNKGRIINVTSVKGRLSVPFNAAYNITKYGGETFSDILRLEMRKFGVKVIIVEPCQFAGITGILNPESPKFFSKEERAAKALKKRQEVEEQVEEQRKKMEKEKKKQREFLSAGKEWGVDDRRDRMSYRDRGMDRFDRDREREQDRERETETPERERERNKDTDDKDKEKPKFFSKEERAAKALKKRQEVEEQVEEQRKKMEKEKKKQREFLSAGKEWGVDDRRDRMSYRDRGMDRFDRDREREQDRERETETPERERERNKDTDDKDKEKNQDDIVFETFNHRSGREFQCMYLNGMRFYLDSWGSKEWQPFPKSWYQEGLLTSNTVVKDAEYEQQRNRETATGAPGGAGGGQSSRSRENQFRGSGGDAREGVIKHPRKGKIPTYIFQRKHNIHCFYDHDNGQWMRMPIGYELHHEMVGGLVDQVEKALPHWNDRHDILSLLRQCNYDADECINTYLHLDGDEWLKAPKTSKEAKALSSKEERLEELEQTVMKLKKQLNNEKRGKIEAERIVKQQEDKITSLEVESKQTEAQLTVLQERPKTPQLSQLQREIESMWNDADEEVRNTYGREYYDVLGKGLEECKPEGCLTVDPVNEAFVDAITAYNPQYRYLVKGGSGLFDVYYVLALLNSYLPTSVMDYLSERSFLCGMPKIKALQK